MTPIRPAILPATKAPINIAANSIEAWAPRFVCKLAAVRRPSVMLRPNVTNDPMATPFQEMTLIRLSSCEAAGGDCSDIGAPGVLVGQRSYHVVPAARSVLTQDACMWAVIRSRRVLVGVLSSPRIRRMRAVTRTTARSGDDAAR